MSSATGGCVSLVRLGAWGWRANRHGCKTGNCNPFDKCDYPNTVGKGAVRAEDFVGRRGFFGPRYQHQGPSKPRDNVAHVVVPVDD